MSRISRFNNVIIPKNKNKGTLIGGALIFNRKLAKKIFPIPEELPNEDRWTGLHVKFFSDIIHSPFILSINSKLSLCFNKLRILFLSLLRYLYLRVY